MAANASCNRVGWLFAHHTTEVGVVYNSAGFTLLAEQMVLSDNRVGFAAIPLGAETMDYGSVNVTQTAVIGYSDNPGAFQTVIFPLKNKVRIVWCTLIRHDLSIYSEEKTICRVTPPRLAQKHWFHMLLGQHIYKRSSFWGFIDWSPRTLFLCIVTIQN